jgi:molybdopterin-guanine dinucleotide biosynthesis protein A
MAEDNTSPFKLDRSSIPGVILAGGRSSRMGRDKAAVTLAGRTLLDRVIEQLTPQVSVIAVNADAAPDHCSRRFIPDIIPGKAGPMAGIHAAMAYAAIAARRLARHDRFGRQPLLPA